MYFKLKTNRKDQNFSQVFNNSDSWVVWINKLGVGVGDFETGTRMNGVMGRPLEAWWYKTS